MIKSERLTLMQISFQSVQYFGGSLQY